MLNIIDKELSDESVALSNSLYEGMSCSRNMADQRKYLLDYQCGLGNLEPLEILPGEEGIYILLPHVYLFIDLFTFIILKNSIYLNIICHDASSAHNHISYKLITEYII